MNKENFDFIADSRKVATPAYSIPSNNSPLWIPITDIEVSHAIMLTPSSRAREIISVRDSTFLLFIKCLKNTGPKPSMFSRLEGTEPGSPGSIAVIIFSEKLLFEKLRDVRSALSPQKVKNIETLIPLDAAPIAMLKAAKSLSKSPLKTTKEARCSGIFPPPELTD